MTQDIARLHSLAKRDGRYHPAAFVFTLEALHITLDARLRKGVQGHIDGSQLLDGIREHALSRFGFLAATVFREWGLTGTRCFGEIVFMLAEEKFLAKQDSDSVDDFDQVYDFEEVFEQPFLTS